MNIFGETGIGQKVPLFRLYSEIILSKICFFTFSRFLPVTLLVEHFMAHSILLILDNKLKNNLKNAGERISMAAADLNAEWNEFIHNKSIDIQRLPQSAGLPVGLGDHIPKCSNIYISTQTKIIFMNQLFNLEELFWNIPVLKYQERVPGILKKQMKISCTSKEESDVLEERLKDADMVVVDVICKVDNPNARKVKYKDIRKINIGLSKKDLISYRKKRKGAFYNCFVLIMRIEYEGAFKEVHLKIFNTGKLEIPGIQSDVFLYKALDQLIAILQTFYTSPISYDRTRIETVLINSNFSCNYFIDRNAFYNIIKYRYKIHAIYDPCSYPGIQCKFYYNPSNPLNDGLCRCKKQCGKKKLAKNGDECTAISFMIFRTGSVLIVGHCDEVVLNIVYDFLKKMLVSECAEIYTAPNNNRKREKNKKVWKKYILRDI